MKIALVGDSLTSRHLAPWSDHSWEIWGVGNGYHHLRRATRYFELHGANDVLATISLSHKYETPLGPLTWWEAPAALGVHELYVHPEVAPEEHFVRTSDGLPKVSVFPFDELLVAFPRRYFTSSFAWLVAFAILQQPSELSLWGCDMSLAEYATQKAAVEYFLGIAEGRGIKVTVPEMSMVLRAPFLYALETQANRRARSILGDQRRLLEREIENHAKRKGVAGDMRMQVQARLAEHGETCSCTKDGTPCARAQLLLGEMRQAVTDETEANLASGQMRARLDENTFYARQLLTNDFALDVDREKEDAGLPMWQAPSDAEYSGTMMELDDKVVATVGDDGQIQYELQAK